MHSEMSSAICFNLDQSKLLSSGNGLTLQNNKIFARDQIESICRRQNKCISNDDFCP